MASKSSAVRRWKYGTFGAARKAAGAEFCGGSGWVIDGCDGSVSKKDTDVDWALPGGAESTWW